MMNRVLFAAAALCLAACASGTTTGGSGRSRDMITIDEIEALPATSAYDLVGRLRPTWLRSRGPASIRGSSPVYPLVYIDEVSSGGLEALNRISSQIIREIRFINGRDATTRWGMDHGGGVILILTGRLCPAGAQCGSPRIPSP